MTVETLTEVSGAFVHYRQAISPSIRQGTFLADDQDNHDFKFDARGKGIVTVAINNLSNKTLSWSLYGAYSSDADVGDDDVFDADVTNNIAQTAKGGATNVNAYPFYILRCSFSQTPDGSTIYAFIGAMVGQKA